MFYNQQFKLCYCPVAMKNVILEFEHRDTTQPKCLNGSCESTQECPYCGERPSNSQQKSAPEENRTLE